MKQPNVYLVEREIMKNAQLQKEKIIERSKDAVEAAMKEADRVLGFKAPAKR